MLPIRALLLDAVGTAIYPAEEVSVTYARLGAAHGSRLTAEAIVPRFRRAFGRQEREDAARCCATSEEHERHRWRSIVAEVFSDVAASEALFEELWRHFSQPKAWRVYSDVEPLLLATARRGVAVVLASNFDARLRSIASGLPALRGLTDFAISSEIAWKKPSPSFFAAVLGHLKCDPAEVMAVGDDRTNDYEGGRRAGLRSFLLERQGSRTDEATITSLDQLVPHLN
jgi:putative hydrolase of the HAD superfamily